MCFTSVSVASLQTAANMPEVRELSEALSEMSMDPITGVGVVASRNRAPTGYDVVRRSWGPRSPWKQLDAVQRRMLPRGGRGAASTGLRSKSPPGVYDDRRPGRRPLERRAFQIQGDAVPVLHQGLL